MQLQVVAIGGVLNGRGHFDSVGVKLRATNFEGTDDFGFSALGSGGRGKSLGGFSNQGDYADFWEATESSSTVSYKRHLAVGDLDFERFNSSKTKTGGYSIRCLKN